ADAHQPSRAASSASAYWRAVDSVCSRTWTRVDCRTYTIARRSRCRCVIVCGPLIACESSGSEGGHEHIRERRHQIRAGRILDHSRKLPPSKQLEIDRRDFCQSGFDASSRLHPPGDRGHRVRRHVQQMAAAADANGEIDVRPVQLPFGTAASGLATSTHLALHGAAQRDLHIGHRACEPSAPGSQLPHTQSMQLVLVTHRETRLVRSFSSVNRPISADTTAASSRRTSKVRGRAAAGAPRSVKCSGRATAPAGPPSHTYTRPRDSSLYVRSKRMATRWPVSGWKGWVISSESEPSLYADAVWRNRRNAQWSRSDL